MSASVKRFKSALLQINLLVFWVEFGVMSSTERLISWAPVCPFNTHTNSCERLLIRTLYSVILTDLNVFHISSTMFHPPSVNTSPRAEQRKAAPLSSFLITIQTRSPPPGRSARHRPRWKELEKKRWRREKRREVKWKEKEVKERRM